MKRKVILNAVVIAVLLALFVVLSLIVDNGAVGQYMDADGFIMTQEQVDDIKARFHVMDSMEEAVKDADLIITDASFNVQKTIIKGEIRYEA